MPKMLGYRYAADWAVMMPLEKSLTVAIPAEPRAKLTREDHATLARLALKMDLTMPIDAIQSARQSHPLCKPCMSVGFPLVANFCRRGPERACVARTHGVPALN